MPVDKPVYQLRLDLDLSEPEGRGSEPLSVEEIRLRSETARAALDGVDVPWKAEYLKLVEGGWDWRVAAYIAWAASPKNSRSPKTQDELAINHLGLTSDRAINTWRRNNQAIDEMVAMMQAAPLWEHRAEIYDALIRVATSPEYKGHNDRKLALELLGDYVPAAKLEAVLKQKGGGNDPDTAPEETLLAVGNARREIFPDSESTSDSSSLKEDDKEDGE